MPIIAIVTADEKSRVPLKGARKGERFSLAFDAEGYHLKRVASIESVPLRNPIRRDLAAPEMDLTEHLDRLRENGLDWKPAQPESPKACRF